MSVGKVSDSDWIISASTHSFCSFCLSNTDMLLFPSKIWFLKAKYIMVFNKYNQTCLIVIFVCNISIWIDIWRLSITYDSLSDETASGGSHSSIYFPFPLITWSACQHHILVRREGPGSSQLTTILWQYLAPFVCGYLAHLFTCIRRLIFSGTVRYRWCLSC